MNDRFKFRMWDKYREEYIYFDFTSLSGALADIEVKITEQCTGLKDKNGTLIYEGDIVKFSSGDFNHILTIKWYERETGFWAAQQFCGGGTWPLSDIWDIEKEIISNIHTDKGK